MAEFESSFLRPIVLRPIFSPGEGASFESFSDRQLFTLLHDPLGQQLARTVRAIPSEERYRGGGNFGAGLDEAQAGFISHIYGLSDEALDWVLESSPPRPD